MSQALLNIQNEGELISLEMQAKLDIAEQQYLKGEFFKIDDAYFENLKDRIAQRLEKHRQNAI